MSEMHQYHGLIAKATLTGLVDDSRYKLRAVVDSGDLAGKEFLVSYTGEAARFSSLKEIVVRLDRPLCRGSRLNLEKEVSVGYFVSSKPPQGFKFSDSERTILYGFFEDYMMDGTRSIPGIYNVIDYYNVGNTPLVLFYKLHNGCILPYSLVWNIAPELMMRDSGNIQSVSRSLDRAHFRKKHCGDKRPRIVVIRDGIDFNKEILPVFVRFARDDGVIHIQMEPQR